jgi:hypothetical protein
VLVRRAANELQIHLRLAHRHHAIEPDSPVTMSVGATICFAVGREVVRCRSQDCAIRRGSNGASITR